MLEEIVQLSVGESLLFCPTAVTKIMEVEAAPEDEECGRIVRMGMDYIRFRTRNRQTADGGKSKLADGS